MKQYICLKNVVQGHIQQFQSNVFMNKSHLNRNTESLFVGKITLLLCVSKKRQDLKGEYTEYSLNTITLFNHEQSCF